MSEHENVSVAIDDLPWAEPPELDKKPAGMEYGYVTLDKKKREKFLHDSTFDEVAEKVAAGEAVEVVVPQLERLAPPSIVESLWPAVQERERRRRETERKNAFFNVCLFGAIALYAIKAKDPAWQIVLILFVLFGVVPLGQFLIGAVRRKIQGGGTFAETRQRTLFSYWLGAGDVPTTRWCVRVLVGMFVCQVVASALAGGNFFGSLLSSAFLVGEESVKAGALLKPLDGEWWRLVSCGLLHGGLLHIGFNGMAFKSVGEVLERLYGGWVLMVTFFLSVLGGSIASVVLMPGKPSVGASGGILGLVGFLLVIGLRHRTMLPADFAKSIIRSLLFMAALGFLARNYIDNAAHAGGLLVGCLVALPLSGNVRELGRFRAGSALRIGGWAAAILMMLAGVWVLFRLVTGS